MKDSVILDLATTIHLFNNKQRFLNFDPTLLGEVVYSSNSYLEILAYGLAVITVTKLDGREVLMRIDDVAYCPEILVNLVLALVLRRTGLY